MTQTVRDDAIPGNEPGAAVGLHRAPEALHNRHLDHEHPGEWERIAFHFHQFNDECYGRHCAESDRLYAAWQAALTGSR